MGLHQVHGNPPTPGPPPKFVQPIQTSIAGFDSHFVPEQVGLDILFERPVSKFRTRVLLHHRQIGSCRSVTGNPIGIILQARLSFEFRIVQSGWADRLPTLVRRRRSFRPLELESTKPRQLLRFFRDNMQSSVRPERTTIPTIRCKSIRSTVARRDIGMDNTPDGHHFLKADSPDRNSS